MLRDCGVGYNVLVVLDVDGLPACVLAEATSRMKLLSIACVPISTRVTFKNLQERAQSPKQSPRVPLPLSTYFVYVSLLSIVATNHSRFLSLPLYLSRSRSRSLSRFWVCLSHSLTHSVIRLVQVRPGCVWHHT
jgi:hypothetical protein